MFAKYWGLASVCKKLWPSSNWKSISFAFNWNVYFRPHYFTALLMHFSENYWSFYLIFLHSKIQYCRFNLHFLFSCFFLPLSMSSANSTSFLNSLRLRLPFLFSSANFITEYHVVTWKSQKIKSSIPIIIPSHTFSMP